MSQLDWGSVPDWVTALITSTSVAVVVISYSRNLYDKAREQAAQVSCRVVEEYIEHVVGSPKAKVISVGFKVTNRSDSSVYDLEVTFPKGKVIGEPL